MIIAECKKTQLYNVCGTARVLVDNWFQGPEIIEKHNAVAMECHKCEEITNYYSNTIITPERPTQVLLLPGLE